MKQGLSFYNRDRYKRFQADIKGAFQDYYDTHTHPQSVCTVWTKRLIWSLISRHWETFIGCYTGVVLYIATKKTKMNKMWGYIRQGGLRDY